MHGTFGTIEYFEQKRRWRRELIASLVYIAGWILFMLALALFALATRELLGYTDATHVWWGWHIALGFAALVFSYAGIFGARYLGSQIA